MQFIWVEPRMLECYANFRLW